MTSKRCPKCGLEKPAREFPRNKSNSDGLGSYCKKCKRLAEGRRYPSKNRGGAKHYVKHGLTSLQFENLLREQGGCCAICGSDSPAASKRAWAIDHDHTHCPGQGGCAQCIRGILCNSCNVGLAHFKDDISKLESAIAYLQRWAVRDSSKESPLF